MPPMLPDGPPVERPNEMSLADLLEQLMVAGVAITTRALAQATPDEELTFPQWRVILILGEDHDGRTVSEVAARVGVGVPATSRQLGRLARRGLVTLNRDPHDRRAARACLTTAGAGVRDAIIGYRLGRIAETIERIRVAPTTVSDLRRLVQAMERFG